jgi:beta-phosphoglucomutase-like phosphatase (HAD superfamily)
MMAIGYANGGHTYAEHAGRLTAAGADFVCADWQEIGRQLSLIGVLA